MQGGGSNGLGGGNSGMGGPSMGGNQGNQGNMSGGNKTSTQVTIPKEVRFQVFSMILFFYANINFNVLVFRLVGGCHNR